MCACTKILLYLNNDDEKTSFVIKN